MIPQEYWRPIAEVLVVPYCVWVLWALARTVWDRITTTDRNTFPD